MTESNYGFQINSHYVKDLAVNENILRYTGEGYNKPVITIYDKDDNEIIKMIKQSYFGFSWEISKKEGKIANFRKSGKPFSKQFILETKDGNYIVTKQRGRRYIFSDILGKEIALLKAEGAFSSTNLVEIRENYDPLIILCVSIIFVYLIIEGKVIGF